VASYLSGQVIGTEVAHAVAIHGPGEAYAVLASEAIGGRYVRAMEIAGLEVRTGNAQAIVRGLAIIARSAGLLS
jgi:2-keto-3-deoxy-galactonokinase